MATATVSALMLELSEVSALFCSTLGGPMGTSGGAAAASLWPLANARADNTRS